MLTERVFSKDIIIMIVYGDGFKITLQTKHFYINKVNLYNTQFKSIKDAILAIWKTTHAV